MLPILAAIFAIAVDATPSGAGGVFSVPTPTAVADGKVRAGFGMDYWRGGDFLLPSATSQRAGGALSGAMGFLGFVEAYGALSFRATSLFSDAPHQTLTSFGDADLGVKVLVPGSGPISAALLLQLDIPSGVGGFSLKGTGGRVAALLGYSGAAWKVPYAASLLAGYRVDNSGALVEGTPATLPAFAYGLSNFDTAQGAATLQVPLKYGAPAAEIVVESPVARRAPLPIGHRPLRARLSLGVAALHTERLPALSFGAALQLSLSRDGRMSELMLPAPGFSPDPPWTIVAGVTWQFDRPALPQRAKELNWHDTTAAAPPPKPQPVAVKPKPKAVLRVTVLDARTQLPIAGAWVSFVEGSDVGGTTGPDGKARLETDPGTLTLAVARDGYELLTEPVALTATDETLLSVSMQPVAPDATIRGRLVGEDGAPLRAAVILSVAGTLPALPSAPQVFEGAYSIAVQHGTYELNATAPGYRCTPQQLELRPGETVTRDLEMRRIAGEPRARLSEQGVEIGAPIVFAIGRETLDPSAHGPLLDVAQALKAEKRSLEVVARVAPGEVDDDAEAQRLSEGRARAVIDFLKARGVRVEILVPRGLGQARIGQPLLELRVPPQKEPRS